MNLPTPIRRALTNELIEGLREEEKYWKAVYNDDTVLPPSGEGGTFRVHGAHRSSPATHAERYTFYRRTDPLRVPSSAGTLTTGAWGIWIEDFTYEDALKDLTLIGLHCGRCRGFPETRGKTCCSLAELYRAPFVVFIAESNGLFRNSRYVSEEEMQVAVALFDACQVQELESDKMRRPDDPVMLADQTGGRIK